MQSITKEYSRGAHLFILGTTKEVVFNPMTHTFLGMKIDTGPHFVVEKKKKSFCARIPYIFEPGLFLTEAL